MANPYRRAFRRERASRARVEGRVATVGGPVALLLAIGAGVFLARGSVYAFLDGGAAGVAIGASGLVARVGLLVAGVLAVRTYDVAVRSPDQAVLAVHPSRPMAWWAAAVERAARAGVSTLAGGAVALAPLLLVPRALSLGLVVLLGSWVAGLGLGLGMNLAAPSGARSPSLAPLWDAIRGANPRAQAALLYAPGATLALAGAGVLLAASRMEGLLGGAPLGAADLLAMAAPFALGAWGLALSRRHAGEVARIPALLGEIDAAHAAAEHPDEARSVAWDGTARWLPEGLRQRYLQELRHQGRGLRPWLTGSWALAALAVVAAWGDPASARGYQALGVGVAVCTHMGVRAAATDPAWLDAMLPSRGRGAARLMALCVQAQAVVWPAVLAVALQDGPAALHLLARGELTVVALAAVATLASVRVRGAAAWIHLPVSALVLGGLS